VLISHPWRGNVRELRNAIDRVVLAETGPMVEAKHFGFLQSHEMLSQGESSNGFPGRLPEGGIELEEVVKDLIVQAIERSGGNRAKAARLLGISKPTLVYRLQKFGLA
jgi:DNA-binding NtrC family response regulator